MIAHKVQSVLVFLVTFLFVIHVVCKIFKSFDRKKNTKKKKKSRSCLTLILIKVKYLQAVVFSFENAILKILDAFQRGVQPKMKLIQFVIVFYQCFYFEYVII